MADELTQKEVGRLYLRSDGALRFDWSEEGSLAGWSAVSFYGFTELLEEMARNVAYKEYAVMLDAAVRKVYG